MDSDALIAKLLELGFEEFDPSQGLRSIRAVQQEESVSSRQEEHTDPIEQKKVVPMLAENEPTFVTAGIGSGGKGLTVACVGDRRFKKLELMDLEPYGFTNAFKQLLMN